MMRNGVLGIAFVLVALPAACVLNADGFTTPPGADAGSVADAAADAGTPAPPAEGGVTPVPEAGIAPGSDAGDGLPAHGPNLLANGGFELGCAGWGGFEDANTESSLARTGTGACQVCSTTDGDAHVFNVTNVNVTAGQRFYGELWLRQAATTPSVEAMDLGIVLRKTNADDEDGQPTGGPVPTTTYQRVTALFTAPHDGDAIVLDLGSSADNGKCIVIDDAAIYLLQ